MTTGEMSRRDSRVFPEHNEECGHNHWDKRCLEGEDSHGDLGGTNQRRTRHQDRFQGDGEDSINGP